MPKALPISGACSQEELDRVELFMTRYSDWLAARATLKRPTSNGTDAIIDRHLEELDDACSRFLTTPASQGWMIWHKLEAFDATLSENNEIGPHTVREAVWMWGCIKSDIMRFGFGYEDSEVLKLITKQQEEIAMLRSAKSVSEVQP